MPLSHVLGFYKWKNCEKYSSIMSKSNSLKKFENHGEETYHFYFNKMKSSLNASKLTNHSWWFLKSELKVNYKNIKVLKLTTVKSDFFSWMYLQWEPSKCRYYMVCQLISLICYLHACYAIVYPKCKSNGIQVIDKTNAFLSIMTVWINTIHNGGMAHTFYKFIRVLPA